MTRPDNSADIPVSARSPQPATTSVARARFRIRWRGYDRDQVDTYRSGLEKDLASTRINYQQALLAQTQSREVVRAMEADLARLRGELTNSPSALSERLREILVLAAQDAADTRAAARAEAHQRQADAQAEAGRIHADAERVRADAERVLQQAQEAADDILRRAHAAQQRAKAELDHEEATVRQQLADTAAEAQRARERADADAAARRDEADRDAYERREQANAAAAARLRETSEQLAELTRQRDEAVVVLSRLRAELHEMLNPPTSPEAAAPVSP